MTSGFWGKKVGMTQFFVGDKVVPVTAIDPTTWVITQIKNSEKDGYEAIQIACLKNKHVANYSKDKIQDWTKSLKTYFSNIREVKGAVDGLEVGDFYNWSLGLEDGSKVDVFGRSIGKGFAGVVKRHNYSGGGKSHSDKLGRHPGGISFMTSQGKVIKGKALPGHMGNRTSCVKSLEVVKVDSDSNVVFIKGSVPGKTGSLLFVRKQG